MRISVKRRSTVSCPGRVPDQDSSLESALHSFLSTIPGGLTRCKKNALPPVEGSPSERRSLIIPSVEKTAATTPTRQERPEKKQPKLQKENEQLDNEGEAEKMREITRKVLRYQSSRSSLNGTTVSGTPPRSEREQNTPATPSTPQPRTRDHFFPHNGDAGSPWTILSPLTCSQRNQLQQNRQAHRRRLSSMSAGDDPDDGVWESDKDNHLPTSSNRDDQTSPSVGSASLPECPSQRAVSQGPMLRSVSMDETRPSPASRFRLGHLFQRSISQRSYSYGSRTESMREKRAGVCHVDGQVSTSGFISFFRRIGGRSRPGNVEERNFRGSNTWLKLCI